jgi:hypothetical protein
MIIDVLKEFIDDNLRLDSELLTSDEVGDNGNHMDSYQAGFDMGFNRALQQMKFLLED